MKSTRLRSLSFKMPERITFKSSQGTKSSVISEPRGLLYHIEYAYWVSSLYTSLNAWERERVIQLIYLATKRVLFVASHKYTNTLTQPGSLTLTYRYITKQYVKRIHANQHVSASIAQQLYTLFSFVVHCNCCGVNTPHTNTSSAQRGRGKLCVVSGTS